MIRSTARVARKAHRCNGCCRSIRPGEVHLGGVVPPGGEFGYVRWARFRECADCAFRYGRGLFLRAAS